MRYHELRETDLRPEAKLLVACAASGMDSERAACIKALLRAEIDWEYLLRLAHRNSVTPLLYWSLKTVWPEAVPEATLSKLQDHFHVTAGRNMFLTRELLKILHLLEVNGIPAIAYKGPALAASAYGNLALREFGDLDFLVHTRHISKACELLHTAGYFCPEDELTPSQTAAYRRYYGEYSFRRNDRAVMIDLHWAITPNVFGVRFDSLRLWERARRISLGSGTVLTFAPDDVVLILCWHGCMHEWDQLKWICDVARVIPVHQDLDWSRILEHATLLGIERMVLLGLFLTNLILDTSLPRDILERAASDPTVKALAIEAHAALFSDATFAPGVVKFKRLIFYVRARERLRDKVRHLLLAVSTPKTQHFKLIPLPRFLFAVYHLFVPVWNLITYGPAIIKHVLRR